MAGHRDPPKVEFPLVELLDTHRQQRNCHMLVGTLKLAHACTMISIIGFIFKLSKCPTFSRMTANLIERKITTNSNYIKEDSNVLENICFDSA